MTSRSKLPIFPVRYAVTALLTVLLLSAVFLPPTESTDAIPEPLPEEVIGAGWKLCAAGIAIVVLGVLSNDGAMMNAGHTVASVGC